jgi:hypothetical protein
MRKFYGNVGSVTFTLPANSCLPICDAGDLEKRDRMSIWYHPRDCDRQGDGTIRARYNPLQLMYARACEDILIDLQQKRRAAMRRAR